MNGVIVFTLLTTTCAFYKMHVILSLFDFLVMLLHFFLLLLTGYLNLILATPRYKIHIGCLVPSYSEDQYGYQTAIELAAEMINNRSDILPDHEIVMVCGDTYVS